MLGDFFIYWFENTCRSFTIAGGVFGFSEALCAVLFVLVKRWQWLRRVIPNKWEDKVSDIAKWCFVSVLAVSIFVVVPFMRHSELKENGSVKRAAVMELQMKATALADQLSEFAHLWSTNVNGFGRGPVYWWDRYDDEFKQRVAEMVKMLGERGAYSTKIEVGAKESQIALRNAEEIRKMAAKLNQTTQ